MSYFDDASLAFLPSGAAGKDGKAYSIKPTDGTGDFTFSRGSNLAATRVGPGPDYFIEKGRENLLLQSNQFDTTWLQNRIDLTSGQSGYDGGSDAWKLESNNASTTYLAQSVVGSGVQTASAYAKAGTANYLTFYNSSGASVWFNLSNGSLGNTNLNIDTKIEAVGSDGWYRCSMTFNVATSYLRVYVTDVNGSFPSAIGANILIQDAQLESGLVATDVIETTTTTGTAGILENTPRFDYSNGASCPSLLLEPSRTQLVRQSEYFQSNHWTKDSNTTLTTNAAISPDGSQNATRFESSSAVSGMFSYGVVGNKTISIYIKAGDTGNIGKSMRLYTTEAAGDFVLTNDWQRISLTGNASNLFALYPSAVNGFTSAFIWGAQGEAGSHISSYIPNHSGGTITRAADVISKDLTSVINNNQMTMFLNVKSLEAISTVIAADNFGDLRWYHQAGNRFRFYKIDDADWVTNSFVVNDGDKIALTLTDTQAKLFVNGSQVGTTFALTTSFQNFTNLSYNVGSSKNEWNQLLIFRTALSDADCITLTT